LEKLRLERAALVEPVKPPEAPANPENQTTTNPNPADSGKPPEETSPPPADKVDVKSTDAKADETKEDHSAEKTADEAAPSKEKGDGGLP
jgi:hypothetical protein